MGQLRSLAFARASANDSTRDAQWRYIRYEDGGEELYDHEEDPGEWNNLAANPENSQKKAEMLDWLHKIITVER